MGRVDRVRRKENHEGRVRAAIAAAVLAGAAPAQWGTPFDHETITSGAKIPNPNATDHLIPFGGYANPQITYFAYGPTFDWQQRLNAVHMALVPKGPHRGKVLVWGSTAGSGYALVGTPVILRTPGLDPELEPNQYWACAAWSIVDPDPAPAGPRFRNFLLPLDRFAAPDPLPPLGELRAPSLFCAGQAWSPYGDLIVAGGTHFGFPVLLGAKLTFAFNPMLETRGWGTSPLRPLYPEELGRWEPGPDLVWDRFYPTTTLTHRLQRLASPVHPRGREVMFTAGGSVDEDSDDPVLNATWNSYEALVISSEATMGASGLARDRFAGRDFWPGPGTSAMPPNAPPVEEDWLEDYPRFHLLSTGKLFFSGYAPRWAQLDHDAAPGVWNRAPLPPWSGTTWQLPRHDGTSVLLPDVDGRKDHVLRCGGADEINSEPPPHGTTPTVEAFVPQGTGGAWQEHARLPGAPSPGGQPMPDGRYLMNIVILPDASLLVLGGVARAPDGPGVPVNEPLLWQNGTWTVLPANPVTSVRDYHATAVLLPDGRVFLGGGDKRNYDYEVFTPPYVGLPKPQNVAFRTPVTFDSATGAHTLAFATSYHVGFDPLAAGEGIERVVLMAPGATTHHSDMHQRYVGMRITALDRGGDSIRGAHFTTPRDDKHAPRGIYMLFLVTSAGGVADAQWIVLR